MELPEFLVSVGFVGKVIHKLSTDFAKLSTGVPRKTLDKRLDIEGWGAYTCGVSVVSESDSVEQVIHRKCAYYY